MLPFYTNYMGTVSLAPRMMLRPSVSSNLLRVTSNKYVEVRVYMLHIIVFI